MKKNKRFRKGLIHPLYGAAIVGVKGQVVIPVKIRKALSIKTDDALVFICNAAHPKGVLTVAKMETMMQLSQGLKEMHASLGLFISSKAQKKISKR